MDNNNNSQFDGIEVFEGKKLSDIFKDIYENHASKKEQITSLVQDLTPLVEGIGDATLLVPLIKEYMELGIKNDEQLVKLAQIAQRMDAAKKIGAKADSFNFDDLQDMLAQEQTIDKSVQEVKQEVEVTENTAIAKKSVELN